MSGRVLIKGGTVLSLDRAVGNLAEGDVLIEDGVIAEIGKGLRARNTETVDASMCIVMPGFVDAHRHAWHSLFRNAGGATVVTPRLVGPHHTPDHVYAATLVGLLGAAEAGITTVVDWADLPAHPAFAEAALQAHQDAGLRTVFVIAGASWEETPPDASPRAAQARSRGIDAAFGPTGDTSQADWRGARSNGLRIHLHAGVGRESAGSIAALGGELDGDVTLIHCTNLGAADMDAIKAAGARVVLAPAVEMTAGYGSPPLQALIDRNIRPGLGVGSEMEAPGDIFAQMRTANSVQHATLFDLKLAGKGGVPNLLTTRDVIRYATIDGANAVGLGEVTGSLAPGKRGDVVVLRADAPNIAPVNDPIGAVVWGMDTSNIDWSFVSGKAVVESGKLVADGARARTLAAAAHREVAAAAGLLVEATETS